jgi:hypothetical protein
MGRRSAMKDPHRDDRRSIDEPALDHDTTVDPIAGAHGGVQMTPGRVPRADEAPPVDRDGDDPRTARSQPHRDTPQERPAVLGRLEGLGLVIVVRDASGGVASVEGTWKPGDESANREELQRTFPEGSTTRYAGTLVESRDESSARDVSVEVVIRHHGEYVADDGRTLHIVNFEVPSFR